MSKKDKNNTSTIFAAQGDPRKYDVYYDLAKSKDNWRKACFFCLGLLILVSGAFILRSFQAKFTPFVVTVNEMGKPVSFGPAQQLTKTDERLVRAEIYEWITEVRSINGSQHLLKQQMNKAFALVSNKVSNQLNQYFSVPENDPRNLLNRWRRSVEVRSIISVDQQTGRYKIEWVETMLSKQNDPVKKQAWEGYITIKHQPPTSTDGIIQNPLGIYITELSWTPISPTTKNQ